MDAIRGLLEVVVDALEGGNHCSGMFCDLSRAFDSMSHAVLVRKLDKYGIRGVVARLVASYFTDRQSVVEVGG